MTRSTPRASMPKRRGFTLIELLVVVAIIAVLISILLPSLNRAREQGKMVKCLANLKSIGTAMHMYFNDTNNWFPFSARNYGLNGTPLHGFYYGGHPGREYDKANREWWGYTSIGFRDTPKGRPFNRYLYSNLPDYDVPLTDPQFETVRNQMGLFECPSDASSVFNSESAFDPLGPKSTFFACGSSYDLNYYFTWNWSYKTGSQEYRKQYLQRSNAFLRVQLGTSASTLIMLLEDPFDSSFWSKVPRRGWHKQMNRHSFLFLDGHSANLLAQTYDYGDKTFAARGPGWKLAGAHDKAASYAWWVNSQDPDYRYKDIAPVP